MREDDGRGPLTAGTAGHVDHGKTALVKALTGVDTDRLAEEKARRLSIELGFAALELPSGRPASIVDVPGHERFIRNMVAGASGIDCFLMVVAADEGVAPQTIEHAAILRALGVVHGLVAITKADRCDPAAACRAAAELLPGRPVVPCSARTGAGLVELVAELERVAAAIPARPSAAGPSVLHIDRSFTVAGHGTVVTGTLSTGTVSLGDRLVVEPEGIPTRVRGIEVHGQRRDRALAGERVAVNLAHVPAGAAGRGDALASAGALRAAYVVEPAADDELVGALALIGDRSVPVTVHHGTAVTAARLTRAGGGTVRLRCRRPLLARAGDRIVIRAGAPLRTLGGARVHAAPQTSPGPEPHASPLRPTAPPPPLSPEAIQLAAEFREAGLRPPSDLQLGERAALLAPLEAHQIVIRLAHGRHAHAEAVEHARLLIAQLATADGSVTLPALRDAIGGSRSQAKALLDHLDEAGFTRRRRDRARVLRNPVESRW